MSVYDQIKSMKLPSDSEWLWNTPDLDDDDRLRAACLREYVRETKWLCDKLDVIRRLKEKLNLTDDQCIDLLRPKFRLAPKNSTAWIDQGSNEEFSLRMELVSKLGDLADSIYPLSPKPLLKPDLKEKAYFSIGTFKNRCELVTDWNPLIDPKGFEARKPLRLKDSDHNAKREDFLITQAAYGCMPRSWIAKAEVQDSNSLKSVSPKSHETSGSHSENIFSKWWFQSSTPLDSLFKKPDGTVAATVDVEGLFLKRSVLASAHPFVLARVSTGNVDALETFERGSVWRVSATIQRERENTQIKLKDAINDPEFLSATDMCVLIYRRGESTATIIEDILTASPVPQMSPHSSVLSGLNSKYKKPFFEKALKKVSALRMARHINDDQFLQIQTAIRKTEKKDPLRSILHSTKRSVCESEEGYCEYAKLIFPMLTPEQRKPASAKRPMTLTPWELF